jgi:hypothetical protein
MTKFMLFILCALSSAAFAVDTNSQQFKDAVGLYRFWYPTVSMEGIFNGMREVGIRDNKSMFGAQADSNMLGFTANQDTPYGAAIVDISKEPYVIEIPAGPFMGLVNDHHQRWIADMGIPGPDAGKGGKYLIVPPGYKKNIPTGYNIGQSDTDKIFVVARIIPMNQDLKTAQARLGEIKIYPLSAANKPTTFRLFDISGKKGDMTLLKWESGIQFWEKLAKVINEEPMNPKFDTWYKQLREVGIQKGKSFKPDAATKTLLEQASREGKRQMQDAAFAANDHAERLKWSDRQWEWLVLTADPIWAFNHDMNEYARDRYFYQAIVMSPAMLKRDPSAGSLYWGAFHDSASHMFDGAKTYKLTVPLPVPARLFWSVTVYDNDTRSLIANGTKKSALRSLEELSQLQGLKTVDLFFGPRPPMGKENFWIKTTIGKGWFAYFRIYGPEQAAYDNTWKPGDFVEIKADMMANEKNSSDTAVK